MNKLIKLGLRILAVVGVLLVLSVVGLWLIARSWTAEAASRLAKGSQVVQTSKGAVEYAEFGAGPAILALHGAPGGYDGGGQGQSWVDQGYRFISPSRPGYLRTPLATGRTPEEQADALAALLDALGVDKATVIASSGGGPVGLQFALRHPTRCQGLVLISAITQRRPFTDAERTVLEVEASDLGSWAMMMLITQKPEWIFPAVDPGLQPNGDPKQYEPYIQMAVGTLPLGIRREGWLNDFEQMSQMPVYPLENITCPTLIVHGSGDTNAPVANAEFAAATIPNAQFIKLEQGSHLASMTEGDTVKPQIEAFVKVHSTDK